MHEDFFRIKEQVRIEDVAQYLLGKPNRTGAYKYPSERTASIKAYPESQSFYDFGRGVGGDVIKLWSHVKGINNWEAMQEIASLYGISTALNEGGRKNISECIKAQERAREERKIAEKREQERFLRRVDMIQEKIERYDFLLDSPHIPVFSAVWTWCQRGKILESYHLDCLFGLD